MVQPRSADATALMWRLGIDPGYTVDFSTNWSARFHVPLMVGLSLDKYYEVATTSGDPHKTFGFTDLALAADVPLKFVPARFGKWTFSSGFHILWLGSNPKLLLAGPPSDNALNGLNVTGGKGFEVWGDHRREDRVLAGALIPCGSTRLRG